MPPASRLSEPRTLNPESSLFGLPYQCQRDCAAEIPRFSRQVRQIFDALLSGPRTNIDLAQISLKYSGRVSDLRKYLRPLGYDVKCFNQDHITGITWYRLATWSGGRP